MQKIKIDGDILEKKNYEFLSQIHDYETIWSRYIGNDKNAKPIEINGIDKTKDNTRKLVWQENYSIFRNLLILKKIKNELEEESNKLKCYDGDNLLTFEAQLLQAISIIYNSIEIFDKIYENLKDGKTKIIKNKRKSNNKCSENQILIQGEYSQKYKDFLNLRHWVTHNVRIFYLFKDGLFLLPSNLNIFAKTNKEGYLWDNLKFNSQDSFQSIDMFIHTFYEKILSDFKDILKKELKFFEENEYPKITNLLNDSSDYVGTTIISGSCLFQ